MLTFLVHFGLGSSHPAVAIYLQMLTRQINDLALDQLATLSHNLMELDVTRQTRVLLQATKILSATRKHQLSTLSTEHRIFLLNAFGSELDFCADLIKESWRNRFEITTSPMAVGLLSAIGHAYAAKNTSMGGNTAPFRKHESLEKWCVNVALRKLDRLNNIDVKSLLIGCRQLYIYNNELLHSIGQRYSDVVNDLSINERLVVWSHLCAVQYFHCTLSSTILQCLLTDNDNALNRLSVEDNISLLRLIAEKCCTEYDGVGEAVSENLDGSVKNLVKNIDANIASNIADDNSSIQPGFYINLF